MTGPRIPIDKVLDQRVALNLSEDQRMGIDAYMRKHGISTRAKAVRIMIDRMIAIDRSEIIQREPPQVANDADGTPLKMGDGVRLAEFGSHATLRYVQSISTTMPGYVKVTGLVAHRHASQFRKVQL